MWFYNYLSANMNNLLDGSFIDQVVHSPGEAAYFWALRPHLTRMLIRGWRHLASIIIWIC